MDCLEGEDDGRVWINFYGEGNELELSGVG